MIARPDPNFHEEGSEGSPMAYVRDDEQKPHIRLSLRASWHNTTKPTGSGDRVNAAFVHGKFTFLSGEICLPCGRRFMSKIRKGFTRMTKNPACPFAVNGDESLMEPRNKTAPHDGPCSARHGNRPGESTEVSRGHSTSGQPKGRPERGKE